MNEKTMWDASLPLAGGKRGSKAACRSVVDPNAVDLGCILKRER